MELPLNFQQHLQDAHLLIPLSRQLASIMNTFLHDSSGENNQTFSSFLADVSKQLAAPKMSIDASNRTVSTYPLSNIKQHFEIEDEQSTDENLLGLFQALSLFLERYLPNPLTAAVPATDVSANVTPRSGKNSPLNVYQSLIFQHLSGTINPVPKNLQVDSAFLPQNQLKLPSTNITTADVTPTTAQKQLQNVAETISNLSQTLINSSTGNTQNGINLPHINHAVQNPTAINNQTHHEAATHPFLAEPFSSVQVSESIAHTGNASVSKHSTDADAISHLHEETALDSFTFNLASQNTQNLKESTAISTTNKTSQFVILPPDKVSEIIGVPLPPNRILLQIQPPELGHIQVDIHVEDDQLAAVIWAESSDVRNLLRTHLPTLNQALLEHHWRPENITIALTSEGFTNFNGQNSQRQSSPHFFYEPERPRSFDESQSWQDRTIPNPQKHTSDGLINVII